MTPRMAAGKIKIVVNTFRTLSSMFSLAVFITTGRNASRIWFLLPGGKCLRMGAVVVQISCRYGRSCSVVI